MEVPITQAYIDPGTGSMLFTILIGLISVAAYFFKSILMKIRYSFTGRRGQETEYLPFVVYSDDKRYFNTFRPILDEFERRGEEAVYYTQSEDDPLLNNVYEHVRCEFIGTGNRSFGRLNLLKADVVLSTTPSLDVYQWKRSRDVKYYVHVLHAPSDVTYYRMFGIDYYDALILSGKFQEEEVRELERIRGLDEKECVILGLPYLDELKKKAETAVSDRHEKTILLAPSWGDNAILKRYGSKIIDALIATGCRVIIRPHPQSFKSEKEMLEGLMDKYPESDKLSWNADDDNFAVLSKADVLISDFSGVIFDYALVFDKPVIYADTSFDDSVYDAWWLDGSSWTFDVLPQIEKQLKEEDLEDLGAFIDSCIGDETLKDNIEKIRRECWANQGSSARLIVDYLVEKRNELIREGER